MWIKLLRFLQIRIGRLTRLMRNPSQLGIAKIFKLFMFQILYVLLKYLFIVQHTPSHSFKILAEHRAKAISLHSFQKYKEFQRKLRAWNFIAVVLLGVFAIVSIAALNVTFWIVLKSKVEQSINERSGFSKYSSIFLSEESKDNPAFYSPEQFDEENGKDDSEFNQEERDTDPPEINQPGTEVALAPANKIQTIIFWATNEPATTALIYQREDRKSLNEVIVNQGYTLKHVLVNTTFEPDTTYYFRAKSSDRAGNIAISEEQSFLTPPIKKNIFHIIAESFRAIFSWAGD